MQGQQTGRIQLSYPSTSFMMGTRVAPPPSTPPPKVRIRAQSFDSPSSHTSITPIEESPYSKSSDSIIARPLPKHDILGNSAGGTIRCINVLQPLHTKMSDESILSDASSASSSVSSSPTNSEAAMDLCADSPLPSRERPHPLTFMQTPAYNSSTPQELPSPFLYQDASYPMHSPWLVRAVLDLYDGRGLDWMSIVEPVERIWGVRTTSAEVLDILTSNGRVNGRRWWD